MERDNGLFLKEKHIYRAVFEWVGPDTDFIDDDSYNLSVYYDGKDSEGYKSDDFIYYDGGGV